jgi:hypothetical protein
MRLNFFPSSSTSELGPTGGITPEQTATLTNITVTAAEINSLAGVTSDIQTQLAGKVPLAGGTLTGYLSSSASPSSNLHAVTKSYVDTAIITLLAGYANTSGATLTGALALSANGTANNHAVTKQQFDIAIAAGGGGGSSSDLTTNVPTWNEGTNNQVGAGWTTFQAKLQAIIAENRRGPLSSYMNKVPHYGYNLAYGSYVSQVMLPDGRIFAVPNNTANTHIYDPISDSVTSTASVFGSSRFGGGCLLKDGRVFLAGIPSYGPSYVYDPVTDTAVAVNGTSTNTGGYYKPILASNGNIVYCIGNTGMLDMYTVASNTIATVTSGMNGSLLTGGGKVCATLLPTGNIFILFSGLANAQILDLASFTLNTVGGGNFAPSGHTGACLMADGKLFVAGEQGSQSVIYDPVANTTIYRAVSTSGVNNGPILLPDGRIMIVSQSYTYSCIYDPYTGLSVTNQGPQINAYSVYSGMVLHDGSVALLPSGATTSTAARYSANYPTMPAEILLSPFWNKG